MNQVKEFARELIALGSVNNMQVIIDYGNTLISYIDTFDVTNIRRAISEFPDLVKKLK
ncbi:MAG: hypothetical protein GY729_18695 [Desulfobacteraceae bacterium]|nr:hypothetical protein [Desulfobacteraceae bacterium]